MLFYIFSAIGVICIIIGVLFIFKPMIIVKFNEVGNKVIFIEDTVLMYPRIFGGIMFLVSLYLMYVGWSR